MLGYLSVLGVLICGFNCWALKISTDTAVIVSTICVWSLIICSYLRGD